jgi:hypothetical protein
VIDGERTRHAEEAIETAHVHRNFTASARARHARTIRARHQSTVGGWAYRQKTTPRSGILRPWTLTSTPHIYGVRRFRAGARFAGLTAHVPQRCVQYRREL